MNPDTCTCGHVEDEHDDGCTIDGCLCVFYDWNGENDE